MAIPAIVIFSDGTRCDRGLVISKLLRLPSSTAEGTGSPYRPFESDPRKPPRSLNLRPSRAFSEKYCYVRFMQPLPVPQHPILLFRPLQLARAFKRSAIAPYGPGISPISPDGVDLNSMGNDAAQAPVPLLNSRIPYVMDWISSSLSADYII